MLQRVELEGDDAGRYYYIQTSADIKAPSILAFHGGGSTPLDMARFCGLVELAERQGLNLVFPSGSGPSPEYLTWNAGICCGHASRRNVDDVGFVARLLDHLGDQYAIEPSRVYATGISNGGMFCYRLAAAMPGRIAAIAPVAGCLGFEPLPLPRVVPVLHIHGTEDHFVPYAGGGGARSLRQVEFPSVRDSLAKWTEVCGLPVSDPQYQNIPHNLDLANDRSLEAQRAVYASHNATDCIVEIRVVGGGHTWPGEAPLWCFLGPTLLSLPASELIWQFFQPFFCTNHAGD